MNGFLLLLLILLLLLSLLPSLLLLYILLYILYINIIYIIILTLCTTVGLYVWYSARLSDSTPRSVGRSVRPVAFSFGILIFLWRLPVVDWGTMLACHRSAPQEKPEATIGKWPVWNSLFGPVSRPRLGDAIGMSASLSVPHPSALVFSFRTVHGCSHGPILHRCQLCLSA